MKVDLSQYPCWERSTFSSVGTYKVLEFDHRRDSDYCNGWSFSHEKYVYLNLEFEVKLSISVITVNQIP